MELIEKAAAERREAADRLAEAEAALTAADRALKRAEADLAAAREARVRAEGAVAQASRGRAARWSSASASAWNARRKRRWPSPSSIPARSCPSASRPRAASSA